MDECKKWTQVRESQKYKDITTFWEWFSEFVFGISAGDTYLKEVQIDAVLGCMPELVVHDNEHVKEFWDAMIQRDDRRIIDVNIDQEINIHFEIDPVKLETERRAILDEQRALNEANK